MILFIASAAGIKKAMTVFGTFLSIFISIFIPALLIALFIVIFCFSVEDRNYLVAGLMLVGIVVIIIGIDSFTKEEQPIVDIEPSIVYNYCPTCGQLIEVESE